MTERFMTAYLTNEIFKNIIDTLIAFQNVPDVIHLIQHYSSKTLLEVLLWLHELNEGDKEIISVEDSVYLYWDGEKLIRGRMLENSYMLENVLLNSILTSAMVCDYLDEGIINREECCKIKLVMKNLGVDDKVIINANQNEDCLDALDLYFMNNIGLAALMLDEDALSKIIEFYSLLYSAGVLGCFYLMSSPYSTQHNVKLIELEEVLLYRELYKALETLECCRKVWKEKNLDKWF